MSASCIFYHLHRSTAIDYGKRFLKDKLANIEIIENYFNFFDYFLIVVKLKRCFNYLSLFSQH